MIILFVKYSVKYKMIGNLNNIQLILISPMDYRCAKFDVAVTIYIFPNHDSLMILSSMLIAFVHFVLAKLMKYFVFILYFLLKKDKKYWKYLCWRKHLSATNDCTQKIPMIWKNIALFVDLIMKYLNIDITGICLSIDDWSVCFLIFTLFMAVPLFMVFHVEIC